MKLIVGLGNPKKEYQYNRHNVGFILLDDYADRNKLSFKSFPKANSMITQESGIYFCKPQTFMNNSGDAVVKMSNFYKISPKDICVIHDDLDLEFGVIKKQFGKGAAGHHGVEDIINKLGTQDFWRIRVGIGRPNIKETTPDYVLADFNKEEIDFLKTINLKTYLEF